MDVHALLAVSQKKKKISPYACTAGMLPATSIRSKSTPMAQYCPTSIPRIKAVYMEDRKFINSQQVQAGLRKGTVHELVSLCHLERTPEPNVTFHTP